MQVECYTQHIIVQSLLTDNLAQPLNTAAGVWSFKNLVQGV